MKFKEVLKMIDNDLFNAIESLNQYVILEGGTGKKITRPLIEEIRTVSRRLNNLRLVIPDRNTTIRMININVYNNLPKIMNEPHEEYKD